tara:strand:- start:82 stop:444 length:363 start_codon:yes stop_codon:yes gene_type:complete
MARQNDTLANFSATTNEELSVSTSSTAPSNTALKTESSPAFLLLQNVGTVPVFYRLTSDADSATCTTASGNYTGILAASTSDEDGTGTTATFSGYTGGLAFCTKSGTGKVNIAFSGRLGE